MCEVDFQPRQVYSLLLKTRRADLAQCERWIRLHSYLQLATIFGALAVIIPALNAVLSIAWEGVPAAIFLALFVSRDRLIQFSEKHRRAVRYFESGLARLDGGWAGTGEPGTPYRDPSHPYAEDLDVFGKGSLFDLLCIARTPMGQDRLAAWLLEPATPGHIRERQEAVAELAARLHLREDIAVLAENARAGVDTEALLAWGEREPLLESSPFRIVSWGLSVLGVTAVIALLVELLAKSGMFTLAEQTLAELDLYFLSMLIVYTAVLWRFKKRTDRIMREIDGASYDLSLIAGVVRRLEAERFTSPRLSKLRAELDAEGQPPSIQIAKLNRLIELIDSRRSFVLLLIGQLLLWDLHLSYSIENWRAVSGPVLRRWLNAVGEIEALSSLAGYYYEHPNDVFPEFGDESPCLDATDIAHPLLNESSVVRNDVSLGPDARLLVVSGSNMAGKSTLLHTLGINVLLAQAGAPVRAKRLLLSPLAVAASIRVIDSLEEGVSRFYAEILRLRQIVNMTTGRLPVFFLIDEFLQGTNSHDRRIGAEALTRVLVEHGAIGLITTHDLPLADIPERMGKQAANVHFEDRIEGGRIHFDYQLRRGVVRTSNAIELMRSVGLTVEHRPVANGCAELG
jgi:MutS domain V